MDKVHVLPDGVYSHYNEVDAGDTDGCEHDVAGTGTNENIKLSSNEGESDTGNPTLLFFGKIRPNKGFDRVPELLDAVSEEVPDVRAVVAGSPDVAPQIDDDVIKQTLESLRAHNRVELQAEYIPNEEVPEYFNQATAVVLPYYDATVSGVAMISYAFETPIVATRTGDLGPMVERDETGLLANPESTEELAERIIELLNDDDLRSELTTNVKRAREDYSWSHIANQTIDLYRDVLDR
jgi:glycosyltransferase involved in cell wall biosynthesis